MINLDMKNRFRGFYPVVVDVETGGFNAETDALLEIAAVTTRYNDEGQLELYKSYHFNIEPFEGANIEQRALEFTGINPDNPLRNAVDEKEALKDIFKGLRTEQKEAGCNRCVLVGHNAWFDQSFLNAAVERANIKRSPFHPFTSFDTASLSALMLGHTVLAQACKRADIAFSQKEAHSALYDATKTAELFCHLVNRANHAQASAPFVEELARDIDRNKD
ncbi:ribonuclease T [Kangiella sediminilitoris]|uniref:Ribonuclease T n=1 Tax=Kangiella sediminilitoris TaxID=1144748 RepID=A0A1B3B9M8_9GAMM|nr:ribonuclease T [Kangiella sediminilitoris]AOE49487.1 Ribonuclease T [Kangiella sediminilitoris]